MDSGGNYADDSVRDAVRRSTSWRGVLRALGSSGTSGSAIRSIRGHAERVSADFSHFVGQRRWTDEQLRLALGDSDSWEQAIELLGLDAGSDLALIQGHAVRLGLNTEHLVATRGEPDAELGEPSTVRLSRAGALLAAAWYTLCGFDVSWPMEPCRYDLLVVRNSDVRRVQVKTTTVRAGGSWKVYLSTSGKARQAYGPDEIDEYFVIDGDMSSYRIPFDVVGGLLAIHLRAYSRYRVPDLAELCVGRE